MLFDEQGNEYDCLIDPLKSTVEVRLQTKRAAPHAGRIVTLTVACAIPKRSKMDGIIDALTQLGVYQIMPLSCKRSVVKLEAERQPLRLKRWERIAQSASEQSQRNTIPIIRPVEDIRELLRTCAAGFDTKLICTVAEAGAGVKRKPLRQVLESARPKNIIALIGPEGDFTDEEVSMACACGFVPVSLGNLVLRTETAAVAAASFINGYLDEGH